MSERHGPLHGIRVIDWTIWQQGPVASMMLADLGAEVIKIEERKFGDRGRSVFALAGTATGSYFETNNRNKRSVAVDLKTPEGVEIVKSLVAQADVFMHNFRPGVPERLGLDYESLRAIRPDLVYGEASAFGSQGPDKSMRGHDLLGLARSGIMMACADPDTGEPTNLVGALGDQMGATMLAFGIMAALVGRERTGIGQKVETSLLGGMMWLQGIHISMQLMNGEGMSARRRTSPGSPLWNCFSCADKKWLALAISQSDRHWDDLIAILERPEWNADPRFVCHLSRVKHEEALTVLLDEAFATQPREEWFRRMALRGAIPYGPVNDIAEAVADPQVLANDYVTTFDHPDLGSVPMLGFPIRLSEMPASIRRRAPEHGEHTEEVLVELLGMDWDQIAQLKDDGILL